MGGQGPANVAQFAFHIGGALAHVQHPGAGAEPALDSWPILLETTVSEAPSTYRDNRPTYKLNEQEVSWTAHKFIGLGVVTLLVAIGIILTAANASGH